MLSKLPTIPNNWKSLLLPFFGLLFVFVLFTALIAAFQPDNLSAFLSSRNAKTIITQTVIVGIGALGMTMVITSGGIDLSAGSQIALSSVACAMTLNAFASGDPATIGGFAMLVAALAAMATGAAAGAFNGSVSCYLKIPSVHRDPRHNDDRTRSRRGDRQAIPGEDAGKRPTKLSCSATRSPSGWYSRPASGS